MGSYPSVRLSPEPDSLTAMSLPFDVFKIVQSGTPVLVEGAEDLDAAIARVNALRQSFPGEYLIVSQATGKRIWFMANGGIKRS